MKKLILLIVVALFVTIEKSNAQEGFNYNDFVEETQIQGEDVDGIQFAWWIPIEFWEFTLSSDPSMSAAEVDEFIQALKPYSIIAVVDAKMGVFGGAIYTPLDSISNSIALTDMRGKKHFPLVEDDISFEVQSLLAVFKPILKNLMGALGENMNFFVFNDYEEDVRIFNPLEEGVTFLNFTNVEYKWETPLASLVQKKVCPKDNELLNGTWKFCPHHGVKLKEQK